MNYTGMGAEPGQVTVPTRTVQEALARIGLDIGAAGADGIWGSTTDRAFAAALSRTGMSTGYRVSADKRSVEMPSGAWVTIQALAAGSPPRPSTPSPTPRPAPSPATITPSDPVILPESSGGTNLVPWIIGGSVLAAIGLYLWFTPAKPVRANRSRTAGARRRRKTARFRGRAAASARKRNQICGRCGERVGVAHDPHCNHLVTAPRRYR